MSQHDQDVEGGNGATVRANINAAIAALFSLSSGSGAPSTTVAYMLHVDEEDGIVYQRDSSNSSWKKLWKITAEGIVPYIKESLQDFSETAFPNSDTVPSVAAGSRFYTANVGPGINTINDFDGFVSGQDVWVRVADIYTAFAHNAGQMELIAGHSVAAQDGDIWHFRDFSGVWKQMADGLGMGRPDVVLLNERNLIGDWGSAGSTGLQTVDVSDDGVPKGARAVLIEPVLYSSTIALTLSLRKNGEAAITTQVLVPQSSQQNFVQQQIWVPLDSQGKFQMQFSAAFGVTANEAYVLGYQV